MNESRVLANKYGYFANEGKEFVITRPDTPAPWVNVICNGDYGLVISQAGSGFSWRTNSALARLNVWHQDLIRDEYGKYVYVRDDGSGEFWSLSWKPCCPEFEKYEVRHGLGYTRITSRIKGIECSMLVFVPVDDPLEIWKVSVKNLSERPRTVSLFTYFEWCLGSGIDTHREFQKTFIETEYLADLNCIFARKRPLPTPPYISTGQPEISLEAFHSVNVRPEGFEGDKQAFLGRRGDLRRPLAVELGRLTGEVGRFCDSVASLHVRLSLSPGEEKTVIFLLGAEKRENVRVLIEKYHRPEEVELAFARTREFWENLFSGLMVETPDDAFNVLVNYWLKYQAISGHIWARTGYYQCSGAYGFRDQLQSSLIALPLNPEITKRQIILHAGAQFTDGVVYHWWHPGTRLGMRTNISDNMLWLPYILTFYLDETGDYSILDEKIPYVDGPEDTIFNHCLKSIELALSRFSPRGLPLIGSGDWNDGLSTVGLQWRGESVWLGHFLVGVLRRFAHVCRRVGRSDLAQKYEERAEELRKNVNKYGWDGEWYWRASKDDGNLIGSRTCEEGMIYLNAQTWAIINDVAPPERVETIKRSIERHLLKDFGPLLLHPAYTKPDNTIGYITRYAPGIRENGGVYTHAGTWCILAYCKLREAEKAYDIFRRMCPPLRALDADAYQAEPYVLPGNTDGPAAKLYGRGSWTWYTGSAAWMFKVCTEWILGIRPTEEGLLVDPCIPSSWRVFKVRRKFRGTIYEIEVENPEGVNCGVAEVLLDGTPLDGHLLPPIGDGKVHKVSVRMGKVQPTAARP
jgi:cellobiose phosphorylase